MREKKSLINKFGDLCTFESAREFLMNPTDDNAKGYIKEYLNGRSKGCIFNIEFTEKESVFSKSTHMTVAFLLGIVCEDIIKERVQRKIDDATNLEMYMISSFEYPWMLCCLYHDMLSKFENEHRIYESLEEFCKCCKINYTIYDFESLKKELMPCEMGNLVPTYSEDTVRRYFNYRQSKGKTDHGIAAGYYVFDRLVKNYFEHRKQNGNENRFFTNVGFHTLCWHEDQMWIFAYCANAIITHNIWHVDEKEELPDEITLGNCNEKKINPIDDPLSFFCALIDTIEPVKYFEKMDYVEILNNLFVEIGHNTITISQTELKMLDLKKWFSRKMKSMPEWLENIVVSYDEKTDEIRIYIGGI